jgi:hypothetical protein
MMMILLCFIKGYYLLDFVCGLVFQKTQISPNGPVAYFIIRTAKFVKMINVRHAARMN